jgi:hypothetical protein
MAFYTDEYKHLLAAERSLSDEIETPGEKSNCAMLARALVDVIRLKRDIRGVPDPKPVEVGKPAGKASRARSINSHAQPLPDPPAAPAPGAQTP